jgi:hypothetical protein
VTATLSSPVDVSTRLAEKSRPHLGLAALLLGGIVLRLVFLAVYRPAFWYPDSGTYIRLTEHPLAPHITRPLGYVVLLKWLSPSGTFFTVTLLQHLLGLALAVATYALLQRRGVARWLSCVAVAPLLLDPLVATLEHYLLPDALFTMFFAGAALAVLWNRRPGPLACAGSGLLLAAAWFTKPTALPAVLVIGLYLIVRRLGWRPVVAYAVAFVAPYAAIMLWIGDRPSVYGEQSGIALYGRAAQIADCDRLDLPADLRPLCPTQPRAERSDRADAMFWRRPAHMRGMPWHPEGAELMARFSVAVVRQQPLDYARVVGKESFAHFVPGIHLGRDNDCLRERWIPPIVVHDDVPPLQGCPPAMADSDYGSDAAGEREGSDPTPLTVALHGYGRWVHTVPVMLSAAVLLTLAALVLRRGDARLDLVMLVLAGPGVVVVTVAVGMYEARYALPALPLAALAGALAWHGMQVAPREIDHGVPPAG